MDVEERKPGESFIQHSIAGAAAGTAEHCGMFPIDTIKVQKQKKKKLVPLLFTRLIFRDQKIVVLKKKPPYEFHHSQIQSKNTPDKHASGTKST